MKGEPLKGALVADLGRGVEICLPAEGNAQWVHTHLRELDRLEYDSAKKELKALGAEEEHKPMDELMVWANNRLVARWCSLIPGGDSPLSPRRFWAWETTDEADKQWRLFVRMSMVVFRYLWAREPAAVTHIIELTAAAYTRCRSWQNRLFGAEELATLSIGGEPHVFVKIRRP